MSCSGGTASRADDTLRIRLESGQTRVLVNVGGEADATYEYRGRLGPEGFHLVARFGGEHPPYYLLLNPRTGAMAQVPAPPVLSPDSTRFAAAIPEWDCAESPDQRLEIWRFADPVPVLEWRVAPSVCDAVGERSGWAAIEPSWRTSDSLAFVKVDQARQHPTPAIVVRDGHGWHLAISP